MLEARSEDKAGQSKTKSLSDGPRLAKLQVSIWRDEVLMCWIVGRTSDTNANTRRQDIIPFEFQGCPSFR